MHKLLVPLFILFISVFNSSEKKLISYNAKNAIIKTTTSTKAYAFENGKWFDGNAFVLKTFYTQNGLLTLIKPAYVDSVIDLAGKFIVPPFGEAHNHNVRYFSKFKELSNQYLKSGIFYVKNPNSLTETKKDLIKNNLINQPQTIDAVFANGGLTGNGGHPLGVVKIMIMRGEWTEQEGNGNFYYTINSSRELETKWPGIINNHPDFIKTYLFSSEEFEKRNNDSKYEGNRGLNPVLLTQIVQKALQAGLRVSVHLETSKDFHNALIAGVDEVSHMPGFRGDPMVPYFFKRDNIEKFIITAEDAKLAASKGIIVVTTLSDIRELPKLSNARKLGDNLNKQNLLTLKKAGVKIAFGSDSFDHSSLDEIDYIRGFKIFTNLALLKMFCETTAATIFPDRKIGKLDEGYEASFLILDKNPLQNIEHIKNISGWIKQGNFLLF